MKKLITLTCFTLILSACGEKIISVQEFEADRKLMHVYLKEKCGKELDRKHETCENAKRALLSAPLEYGNK
ncbi:EexN family lipoprotein [Pasteurella sp. PK-2025]|uniref:EexN family lipoprotein n=1 Tax=Pasteurella sp. PK-2025 TaxID=3413133 RepID=UPI003C741AFF